MYKLQLIRKYLFKRRIAWVALVAVMLCTAMVLVVVSVMSGWLRSFENSFHGMTGDVVIVGTNPLGGFTNYREMIDGVRKLADVDGAVPVIRTFGLLNLGNLGVQPVQVLGYPKDIGSVNDWPSTLHLNNEERKKQLLASTTQSGVSEEDRKKIFADVGKLPFSLHKDEPYEDYVPLRARTNVRNRAGMIVSTAVVGMRHTNGPAADDLREIMYQSACTLTLVPVKGNQGVNVQSVQPIAFWIVDDSKSRLWQLDNNNVYISFEEAQNDLGMIASEGEDSRCSEIEIKAKPGADLNALKAQIMTITDRIRTEHEIPPWYNFKVETWIEQQGAFIKAVQNEVVLTTALFGIISMVAVLLIFCIFYMIVVEKTKDIGIIKSVGATGSGILSLFLGYGLAIGVIGAGLGFGFAYFFVKYINELHAWLGRQMGIVIWSPETYQFDKIPNQMETKTVIYVLLAAVLSALIGAMVPAMRAAMMNPVEALRYE